MNQTKNYHKKRHTTRNYNQNYGKPGVVYILRNEAFKENWLKVGQSTRSGHKRAEEINRDAGTGLPKHHFCVFEYQTNDCGRAEKAIHKRLASYRKGNQEYFEVDIALAKEVIFQECSRLNTAAQQQAEKESLRRKAEAEEQAAHRLETQRQEKILEAQRAQQERNRTDGERAEQLLKRQAQEEAAKLEAQREERNPQTQRMQYEKIRIPKSFFKIQAEEEEKKLAAQQSRQAQKEHSNRMEFERIRKLAEETSRRATAFTEKPEQEKQIRQAQDAVENLAFEHARTRAYGLSSPRSPSPGSPWRNYANTDFITRPPSNPRRKLRLFLTILILTCPIILIGTFNFIKNANKEEQFSQSQSTTNKSLKLSEETLPAQKKEALVDAATEAIKKYPYLGTAEGNSVIKLIIAERDKRISEGSEPAVALSEAVALLAPKYAPKNQR